MAFEFKNCKLADGTEIKGLYEIQPKILAMQEATSSELTASVTFLQQALQGK